MNAIRQFISRVKKNGTRRKVPVIAKSMGRERTFRAWDVGEDTFVFEDGVGQHLGERPSVLVAAKADLGRRTPGHVLTMTTGNHSVAALPLLDGRFWKIARIPSDKRGDKLMKCILCANVVDGKLDLSQRDVPTERLVGLDGWLIGAAGFGMQDVVLMDRNEVTLEHYRKIGAEWRVRPLVWTEGEMKAVIASSRKRIATAIDYYHSARGVHFLTFPEFKRKAALAESHYDDFVKAIKELVSVYEGQPCSFARMVKYRGHHEIELFGLRRGFAVERVIPELERLMEGVALGRMSREEQMKKIAEIVTLYESLLTQPELADENSPVFIESLYMHLTGEIYAVMGEGSTPSFDDRRTALPGATFVDGRPVFHPGVDDRSYVLLSNLRGLMSKDEYVEYVNVYELRDPAVETALGKGKTREIVYKTNRRPLENSLVEKRLSSGRVGYSAYVLARIGVLRAMGVSLSSRYLLLRRRAHKGNGHVDFYVRTRCEGESMDAIPTSYFRDTEDSSVEDREVVVGVARLMGDAAAQTMAMKKFDPKTESPLFGVGKEIYDFEYDVAGQRVVPKSVSICSIRGSFGWPTLTLDDENLRTAGTFYFTHFAHVLKIYQRKHTVPMAELAEAFMDGFAARTRTMAWQLSVMRDQFEAFDPKLPSSYAFAQRWRFVMWSLERQERRIPIARKMFFDRVVVEEAAACSRG